VTVEFGEEQSYHRDSLEDPIDKQLVGKILCERLGRDVAVKFEIKKKVEKEAVTERPSTPRKEIQNIKKNPLIQSALEMFQAQVVDIRR
jgi:hypothetical protein